MIRKRNKKGSLQDVMFIGIVLLVFGIAILFGFKIMGEINTQIQASDVLAEYDTGSHARDASSTLTGHFSGIIDNSFLFLTIGLGLVTLALAALVRVHPIFIAFYFIGLVIVIFLSAVFSNIYQEMAASTELIAVADQLTFTSLILNYLPFIIGIFGILIMIVMYKLWNNAE